MSQTVSDTLAELVSMRASGEISPEEFTAARDRLKGIDRSSVGLQPKAPKRDGSPEQLAAVRTLDHPTPVSTANHKADTTKKKKNGRIAVFGLCAVFITISLLAAGSEKTFKRSDYEGSWPYPGYDTATVRCELKRFGAEERPIATVEIAGKIYGLNGAARGVGGYADPSPLESYNQSAIASTRQKMIDYALKRLCGVSQ